MRPVGFALLTLASLGLTASAAPPEELFPAPDFAGWEFSSTPASAATAVCAMQAGGVVAVTGQPVGFLATKAAYENYRLHVEWRWSGKTGNGGILVHISSGAKLRGWPLCLQIQTKFGSVGDLLPMAGATFAEPLTSAPGAANPQRARGAADSEKPAGEWNACDITCRGDTIEVKVNGVLQNSVTHTAPAAGRIGFQLEGTPFELRQVSVVRLD